MKSKYFTLQSYKSDILICAIRPRAFQVRWNSGADLNRNLLVTSRNGSPLPPLDVTSRAKVSTCIEPAACRSMHDDGFVCRTYLSALCGRSLSRDKSVAPWRSRTVRGEKLSGFFLAPFPTACPRSCPPHLLPCQHDDVFDN